jgi:AraC family transcriptional regulator, arabinose operon regulatory protein
MGQSKVAAKRKVILEPCSRTGPKAAADLAWLSEVEEAGPPETPDCRIWVKSGCVRAGGSTIPHPHRHSFCELSLQIRGTGVLHAGRESVERKAGDLLLMGAQVPHWYQIESHPVEYVTIYFFPTALVNWVSPEVSILLLQRFTASQALKQRNVPLPEPLLREFTKAFGSAAAEFQSQRFGWELLLQTSLIHRLVTLARWERGLRRIPKSTTRRVDWERLDRVLQHLRQHLAEPVYGHDLARLAGMSESSLNAVFRATLGMTWVKYLQGLRVQRALALLAEPGQTIASAAFAAGFESISHFNSTFRRLMGMSPKALLGKQSGFS